jgi:predicted DNA-binding transcriptional regulator AlpA
MKENLLTVKEIASCLKMSTRAIWNYRDMGFMPAPIKLRGTVRWREKDIVSWIESGCPDCRKNKGYHHEVWPCCTQVSAEGLLWCATEKRNASD